MVSDWKGQLPDLRETFQPYDIDWLLAETIKKKSYWCSEHPLIDFVIDTGYKDEPDLDENGKPLLQRTTAIQHAAKHGKQIIDELCKIYDRFDLNYIDDSGLTHFHVACEYGCDEVVKEFLEFGQDPNCIVAETGDSPLHSALQRSYVNAIKVVQWLLGSGADLHLVNKDGDTPLHLALEHRHEEIAESILRSGIDLSLANKDGLTPLHLICSYLYFNIDLLEIFFQINDESNQLVRLDARDNEGNTALHLAVHENEKAAKLLLKRDANPNLANSEGLTPLQIICSGYRHYNSMYSLAKILFDLSNDKYRPL
uniref:Uncharacterized protein n=1 Tax=Trichogramma kaykai TaxID=54128 RepID=A0ABD2WUD3_9HYME